MTRRQEACGPTPHEAMGRQHTPIRRTRARVAPRQPHEACGMRAEAAMRSARMGPGMVYYSMRTARIAGIGRGPGRRP